MDREEAIKANKNGATAGCISGLLTFLVVGIALTSDSEGPLSYWNDPLIFLDGVLILILAYGMYRNSRTAAITIFIYFIISKIVIGLETGQVSGVGVSLIFLYFFGRAIQGSFVFHRLEKAENPEYKPTPRWVPFVGVPILVLVAAAMGFGLLTMTDLLPSTEVQSDREIYQKDKDMLISSGIIYRDDAIEYFYSHGVISILEGGHVLTDDRVMTYLPDDDGKIDVYEIYLTDVASVELVEAGGILAESVYRVTSKDDEVWLDLYLSTEDQGDAEFVRAIKDRISGSPGRSAAP